MVSIKTRYKKMGKKQKATLDSLYELVFMLRHDVSEQNALDFCKHLEDVILNNSGSVKKTEYWGLRQLAYRINKNTKAHYYFWQIESNKKLNVELGRIFGVSDKCLRHLIVRVPSILDLDSALLANLQSDITSGATIFNDKYIYNS